MGRGTGNAGIFWAVVSLTLLVACDGGSQRASRGHSGESTGGVTARIALSQNIVVDQFGYRPGDIKVAVIRRPEIGFDAGDGYSAAHFYDVRQVSDGHIVFTGIPAPWRNGDLQESSGDRGWWFDFSSVSAPGEYVVVDPTHNVRSAAFKIGPHVYKDVLKAAVRTLFYQRSGFRKEAPYADSCWQDDAAYVGKNQDTEAHEAYDPSNAAKVRDLSGGWFDAGDTNKYVTKAVPVVHQLLSAFEQHPSAFTDDFNIPESGNGIPDVLDEVKWELDWLKKMQYADGSAALKVGSFNFPPTSPPSSDSSPRYYVPSCTSATIAVAGMFAHAAYVFGKLPELSADADELRARGKAAWRNFIAKSKEEHCDTGLVKSGNADWNASAQEAGAVVAAVYLYAITGDDRYESYIEEHHRSLRAYGDMGWSRYDAEQGDALMFYTSLPNANSAIKSVILQERRNDVQRGNGFYGFDADSDLYRAYMHDGQYHWGSNQIRANYGNSNLDVSTFDLGFTDVSTYRLRALEILHYFHGVNPFGVVFLSNMYGYGATRSVNELMHGWYARYSNRVSSKLDRTLHPKWINLKSKWNDAVTSSCGPAPGFLPGGPNKGAEANGVPHQLSPPVGQPAQKSYRDWNIDAEAAWIVNEPAIYYQSAYIKLLSAFAD